MRTKVLLVSSEPLPGYKPSLAATEAAAREKGMSYGMYVAKFGIVYAKEKRKR